MAVDVWRRGDRLPAFARTVTVKSDTEMCSGPSGAGADLLSCRPTNDCAAIDRVRWVARAAKHVRLVGVILSNVAEPAMAEAEHSVIFSEVAAA